MHCGRNIDLHSWISKYYSEIPIFAWQMHSWTFIQPPVFLTGAFTLERCDVSSQSGACIAVHGAGTCPTIRRCTIHGGKQADWGGATVAARHSQNTRQMQTPTNRKPLSAKHSWRKHIIHSLFKETTRGKYHTLQKKSTRLYICATCDVQFCHVAIFFFSFCKSNFVTW